MEFDVATVVYMCLLCSVKFLSPFKLIASTKPLFHSFVRNIPNRLRHLL